MIDINELEKESNKIESMNVQAINLATEIEELKDKFRRVQSKNMTYKEVLLKIQTLAEQSACNPEECKYLQGGYCDPTDFSNFTSCRRKFASYLKNVISEVLK